MREVLSHASFRVILAVVLAYSGFQVQAQQTKPTGSSAAGDIYKKASPAVVLIEMLDEKGEVAASGSGFLISADGKIITNFHVIKQGKQATVRLANKDAYDYVDVLDVDKRKDIALIKIKAIDLPFLTLGKSSAVDVGDPVFTLSSPLGVFQNTLSEGIVSGIRAGDGYKYFQLTAPISHGSSGGPIFNVNGEVVGIAVAIISEGQNLNFAVPVDYAKGMLSSNQAHPLAAYYQPDPPPEAKPTPAAATAKNEGNATSTDARIKEMKDAGMLPYLDSKFKRWSLEDAKLLFGEPHGHRFGVGDPIPEVYAFDDPTKQFRTVELTFDGKTGKLQDVYIYPWNATWDDCKKLWGDDVRVLKKLKDGGKIYGYKNRRINVYVNSSGGVINVGMYAAN